MKIRRIKTRIHKKNDGSHWFTMSNNSVDRHGTIVDPQGMQELKQRYISVLFDHGYGDSGGRLPIGKIAKENIMRNAREIVGLVEYDTDARSQLIRQKVDSGSLSGGSIGFNHLQAPEKNNRGNFVFKKWELMEFTVTPTQSNREALKRESEFIRAIIDPQYEQVSLFGEPEPELQPSFEDTEPLASELIDPDLLEFIQSRFRKVGDETDLEYLQRAKAFFEKLGIEIDLEKPADPIEEKIYRAVNSFLSAAH